MKKQIVFVMSSLYLGGAEKNMVEIANYLASKKKFKIDFFIIKNKSKKEYKLNPTISKYYLNYEKTRYSFFKLVKLFSQKKYDFVFTSIINTSFLILLVKKIFCFNFKVLIRESNFPPEPLKFKKNFNNYLNLLLRKSFVWADYLICPNNEIRDYFKNKNIKKIITLYNPIDKKKIERLAKLRINSKFAEKKFILFIGHNKFQKNIELAIYSFDKIIKKNKELNLIILGRNYSSDFIKNFSVSNYTSKKIHFVGEKYNPYNYIKNSKLVISTSRWEGMPNSILETLILNKKILITNFKSGPKDILKLGGNLEKCDSFDDKKFSLYLQKSLDSVVKIDNSAFIKNYNEKFKLGIKSIINIIEKE